MGRTACTESPCLYKGALLTFTINYGKCFEQDVSTSSHIDTACGVEESVLLVGFVDNRGIGVVSRLREQSRNRCC
jgi:hypothetical protein